MMLWEFSLKFDDGRVPGNTVLAEGVIETEAAASALTIVGTFAGVAISGHGKVVLFPVDTKWREIYGDNSFPQIVSRTGRLATYARRI